MFARRKVGYNLFVSIFRHSTFQYIVAVDGIVSNKVFRGFEIRINSLKKVCSASSSV